MRRDLPEQSLLLYLRAGSVGYAVGDNVGDTEIGSLLLPLRAGSVGDSAAQSGAAGSARVA